MATEDPVKVLASPFDSPTFGQDVCFSLDKPVGSASISPCGRDVVLASRQGLHIIDLDSPYSPPRYLPHHTPWEVADVQWSPFASRDSWVVSTSNQKALLWNLEMKDTQSSIEHVLHGHTRAITDINFSAHHPDILATCAVDSFVHCWDIRQPRKPALSFCDWYAGATQVKWNRQDAHILASSHDKVLRVWDDRKGAYPLRSIEAHSTKIYGVDWDRTATKCLATCSLDRTIKFWDYTIESDRALRTIHAGFPVWRARYTPFGTGLLAMPQREDNDLHLYDRRDLAVGDSGAADPFVHSFGGHQNQVKEFLWRPRGTVHESVDDREFQLVSWGADRVLRLHKLGDEVLKAVGYEKSQSPKAHLNLTRKNAIYKTFREAPSTADPDDRGITPLLQTHSPAGMRVGTTAHGLSRGFASDMAPWNAHGQSMAASKAKASQDMDPVSWMKGVKIGKREPTPATVDQSLSSLFSPGERVDHAWEKFESLREEITHVGEKFSKVAFQEFDMLNRRALLTFSGPWGIEQKPIWMKCHVHFPNNYPNTATPRFRFEKTSELGDERLEDLLNKLDQLLVAYCEQQLSSLEACIYLLLGERTFEEVLQVLEVPRSVDLEKLQSSAQSSSDDDDDDLQVPDIDISQETLADINSQYNVPLPKACGALWANDGRLICFFPHKVEKAPSILDAFSLKASERSARSHRTVFEGFGYLSHKTGRGRFPRFPRVPASSGSDSSEYSYSSSSSSSSSIEGFIATNPLFMPSISFGGTKLNSENEVATDESQWSSGDAGPERPSSFNYVSLLDCQDLLPSKLDLARGYVVSEDRHRCCTHNARIASEANFHDLADIWSLVDLIACGKLSADLVRDPWPGGSILTVARRAVRPFQSRDSAIDLSYDMKMETNEPDNIGSVGWGQHPFGQQWLVEELVSYFEGLADVQMLAILSCLFSEPKKSAYSRQSDQLEFRVEHRQPSTEYANTSDPAAEPAVGPTPFNLTMPPKVSQNRRRPGKKDVSTMSNFQPTSDRTPRLSTTTTPFISFMESRTGSDLYESQNVFLSTSPEQLRHIPRSSSNLASAFAASLSRPFSFAASASSSPPTQARKRLSPATSYTGGPPPVGFGRPSFFAKSAVMTQDLERGCSLPISDTEETSSRRKCNFETKLKNQDHGDFEGSASVPLLAASDEWKYKACRETYAEMLFAWGLPIQMCEILKYNSPVSFAQERIEGRISDMVFTKGSSPKLDTPDGLDMRYNCSKCRMAMNARSADRSCPWCSKRKKPLFCLLCASIIRGLTSPCLSCGHALHSSCRALLQSQLPPSDDPSDDQTYYCISGCGCQCDQQTSLIFEEPEAPPHKGTEGGETVILNEQEALGWRDEPFHDAAYESLARNLGTRRTLTPKTSQIWRGGGPEPARDRKRSVGSSLRYEESFGL